MNSEELEEIRAAYFSPDAIRSAPRPLYRKNVGDARWYFTIPPTPGADGQVRARTYPSVTTVIGATTPTSPHLMKWISDHGQRRAEHIRDERAAYGVLMHLVLQDLVIAGTCDLNGLADVVEMRRQSQNIDFETSRWAADLKQDVVAFCSFWQEHRCKALAIEIALASDSMGYAGAIDLVVEMDVTRGVGAGRPKVVSREIALLDWKSSRVALHEEGAIQTHAYKALWNAQYPELEIVSTFLYGAKDWNETSRERYRLQETTDHPLANAFPGLLQQWKLRQTKSRTSLRLAGKASLTANNDGCVVSEPLEIALAKRVAERATGGTKR